jgi:hypothetical protein
MSEEYSCPCPQCGEPKVYKIPIRNRNLTTLCRKCAGANRRTSNGYRTKYTRECCVCGDIAEVTYIPKEYAKCPKCANKDAISKMIETKKLNHKYVRYWYFCRYCSSVRASEVKRKTSLCSDCNRRLGSRKKITYDIEWDYETMRYYRICRICEDVKQVNQASLGGIKTCNKCKHLGYDMKEKENKRLASLKDTVSKRPPKKKQSKVQMSKKEIERLREINRKHREAVAKQEKLDVARSKSEEDMIAEYLAKNKPKVLDTIGEE